MTIDEALKKYKTVTLSTDVMFDTIKMNPIDRSIDCRKWFSLVPEIYRPAVLEILPKLEEEFLGELLTKDSLHNFIYRLHQELCLELNRSDRNYLNIDYRDANLN